MEKMNSISNERVCDLMDGHHGDGMHAGAFDALLADRNALQTWHTYHVIGDVLRSAELAPTSSDHAFLERLERRLAQEPVRPVVAEPRPAPKTDNLPSANASVFRWKILSGVACVALVGVLGANMWMQTGPRGEAQMAVQAKPAPQAAATLVTTGSGASAMLRDPHLDELMAAHRQLGGHSALQVPAGFVRNATFEGPAR
jgi:sigma-E factor negative regulatory protein RseA